MPSQITLQVHISLNDRKKKPQKPMRLRKPNRFTNESGDGGGSGNGNGKSNGSDIDGGRGDKSRQPKNNYTAAFQYQCDIAIEFNFG